MYHSQQLLDSYCLYVAKTLLYVTRSGKTSLIHTSTEIHFLSVRESYTHDHALPRKIRYLISQMAFYRCCWTMRMHFSALRGINRTAWGTRLLLSAVLALPMNCTSSGSILKAQQCCLKLNGCLNPNPKTTFALWVTALTKWSSWSSTKDFIFAQDSSRLLFSLLTCISITLFMHSGQVLWYCFGELPKPPFHVLLLSLISCFFVLHINMEAIEEMSRSLLFQVFLRTLTYHWNLPQIHHLLNPQQMLCRFGTQSVFINDTWINA